MRKNINLQITQTCNFKNNSFWLNSQIVKAIMCKKVKKVLHMSFCSVSEQLQH